MKKINYNNLFEILPKRATCIVSHAAATPTRFLDYLARKEALIDFYEIIHMIPLGDSPYFKDENKHKIKHNSLFVGKSTRDIVFKNIADYTPIHFSSIPKYIANLSPDLCVIQVSRTINNKVSLGVSVDYGYQAFKSSKIKIGIQNKFMPYTYGDGEIEIDEFDYIVEDHAKLHEISTIISQSQEVYNRIANHISQIIRDNCTLQLGIGNIPDMVLTKLHDKKNLGIHSEMVSDSIIDLIDRGVINNLNKSINKGLNVVSFAIGTKKLYDYLDLNKNFLFKSVDYVNNPLNISHNLNMVSINSALEVDLQGQVNAETLDGKQISGVGGQVDFVRGSQLSSGGISVIALPSTDKTEKISRIVSKINSKNIITTTRNDVDYICTEYGIVQLSGKSTYERKRLMVSISHPMFRESLRKEI